jgi:hypothetical protein
LPDLELTLLIAALAAAWFWLDSLHARDVAVAAGKQAADRYGLQFLDDTVAFAKLWAARDADGRMRFQRTYHFEVSDTGADRLPCRIVLLGKHIEALYIPPHRD